MHAQNQNHSRSEPDHAHSPCTLSQILRRELELATPRRCYVAAPQHRCRLTVALAGEADQSEEDCALPQAIARSRIRCAQQQAVIHTPIAVRLRSGRAAKVDSVADRHT